MFMVLFKSVKGILKYVSSGLYWAIFVAEFAILFPRILVWLGIQQNMISFWLLRLFDLASNFAISVLFNFFVYNCHYSRLGVRKYMFRVPALGARSIALTSSLKNQGFSWEMFFNLNFSIDDGCNGSCIILFGSIHEDIGIIRIVFIDFLKFFLKCYWMCAFL